MKQKVSEEAIKEAIRKGWTQMKIISELGTHSQKINKVRGAMEGRKVIKEQHMNDTFLTIYETQMY